MCSQAATQSGWLDPFAPLSDARTWRTAAACLRVPCLRHLSDSPLFHHALNRARRSASEASRVLLTPLSQRLNAGRGPLIPGLDEGLEP